jgi:hypothetical protein
MVSLPLLRTPVICPTGLPAVQYPGPSMTLLPPLVPTMHPPVAPTLTASVVPGVAINNAGHPTGSGPFCTAAPALLPPQAPHQIMLCIYNIMSSCREQLVCAIWALKHMHIDTAILTEAKRMISILDFMTFST